MKRLWKGFIAIFSSNPEKWPSWFRKYDDWMQKDGIWLIILVVFLMALLLVKTLKDRIEILEHRIRRIEEPQFKPKKDVALACDMLNLEHIMTEDSRSTAETRFSDFR